MWDTQAVAEERSVRVTTLAIAEDFFLDWDAWMETRLHPMKIVDDLVSNAVAGRVEDLEQSLEVAQQEPRLVAYVATFPPPSTWICGVSAWICVAR